MNTVLPSSADPAGALMRVRAESPLVQCVTNTVVTGFTANVLLALGASPAMVDIPDEAGLFAEIAGASLVNLGTPTAEQRRAALEVAESSSRWVLDPVAVGALPVRTPLAHDLIGKGPAIIRGNPSEILTVSGDRQRMCARRCHGRVPGCVRPAARRGGCVTGLRTRSRALGDDGHGPGQFRCHAPGRGRDHSDPRASV